MVAFKSLIVASILAFLADAAPSSSLEHSSDVKVFVRDADFGYAPSHELAHEIKAREASLPLHKRSTARVQACYTPQCTDCREVFYGDFNSNSACIPAVNTACLIVSNLSSANIKFWNRAACNGNMSKFGGCPAGSNTVGAPGTNSIGVHTGC
jgi:hypothetical protein